MSEDRQRSESERYGGRTIGQHEQGILLPEIVYYRGSMTPFFLEDHMIQGKPFICPGITVLFLACATFMLPGLKSNFTGLVNSLGT